MLKNMRKFNKAIEEGFEIFLTKEKTGHLYHSGGFLCKPQP